MAKTSAARSTAPAETRTTDVVADSILATVAAGNEKAGPLEGRLSLLGETV
jgi:hypothetical protein